MKLLLDIIIAYTIFGNGRFFRFVDWIHPKIETLVYRILK